MEPGTLSSYDEPISTSDSIWNEYIDKATLFDLGLTEQWRQGLDSILLFVTLLIAILVSFVVEVEKQLKVDPAVLTNELLLAIYTNQVTGNATLASNFTLPAAYTPQPAALHKTIQANTLLFSALTLCVVTATTAAIIRLWVYRYRKQTMMPGSGTAFQRAMRRQQAFTGVQAWKMDLIIDILPLTMVPSIGMFWWYIYTYVEAELRLAGYVAAGVFAIGLSFLVVTQLAGAFVPGCPFQSPLSDFIRWLVDALLPRASRYRVPVLCTACPIILAGTLLITIYTWTPEYLLGFYFAAGSLLATQTTSPKLGDKHFALLKDPGFTLLSFGIIFPLLFCAYVKAWCNGRQASPWIMFYLLACLIMIGLFIIMKKLAKPVPDNTQAEAIAWLLRSPDGIKRPNILTKACKAAQEEEQKALLLSTAFPLLHPLLETAVERGYHHDIRDYLDSMVHLSSFDEKEQSLRRNQASMVRPEMPEELSRLLERLTIDDTFEDDHIRDAAYQLLAKYNRSSMEAVSAAHSEGSLCSSFIGDMTAMLSAFPRFLFDLFARYRSKNKVSDEENNVESVTPASNSPCA